MSNIDASKIVFVFGSNEGGIHGAGAARFAYKERGARWGHSYGHYGQSFAIPTKGIIRERQFDEARVGHTLPLDQIRDYVTGFLAYAKGHPELQFQVTCIGCGLAGLKHADIAPMFEQAPANCFFDLKWKVWLERTGRVNDQYWGEA